MPLKIGVLGVGAMGENHVRNYVQLEREGQPIQLIGVHDVDPARMKEVFSKYRVPVFSSPDDLLAEADAVSVCTPTTLHEESVLQALEAGCHVLVEKPIASTLAQAERMAQAAKRSGKVLMVGHSERFNPAVFALKERIDRGELGEIVSIGAKRGGHNSHS